ncbi:hypothetical protein QFZ36_004233 [Pseudarthrobacter siccitolerans]|uniref:Fibronectin type-III domain-containing protein n=1 Tax=Pseudarthrobacter siccitolerans TaxID=861266 RepID=A0ABU0PSS1_9MICC|nr:hypothetical protein [Pseudarthrobacter siccitolerans]MDQ0676607.1 hypothetical protein [Pseudarthrobacter siccitolerans]
MDTSASGTHSSGSGQGRRRWLAAMLSVVLGLLMVIATPGISQAAVTISKADSTGGRLRIEGNAIANRPITVDGVQMATSDGAGRFKVDRSGFTAPADCTVDVNDGSAAATSARLTGCTVTTPPPPTGPPAPVLLSPANSASVTTPFTISWSQVLDPASLNGGYNWQISSSSAFTSLVLRDSTAPNTTQASVSGLVNGTYFWRVQAVDGELRSSAFSAARSFIVTGATADQPGTSVLSLPPYGSSFHPFESFGFTWTAAVRAVKYEFVASKDSTFPAGSIKIDNIETTSTGLVIGDFCGGCEQGTYFARVVAIDVNGNRGIPSNTVSFIISYTAPLPPAPTGLAPADGATVTLPVTLDWSDVPNPQDTGYEVEISRNSSFTDIEDHIPQITPSQRQVLSLTSGTKFWRVRSHQGDASPTTSAVTDWSVPRSFTIANTAAAVQSVWLGAPPCQNPCPGADSLFSGQEITGSIQLTTAAPAGGAVVSLASSPASGASHPASVTVPAGTAFTTFTLIAGEVLQPTPVTLTATLGSSSASFNFTVHPTTLKRLSFCCDSTGGLPAGAFLEFTGKVPAGGLTVNLSSDSPLATPPATVTAPAGSFSLPVSIPTSEVTATTTVTISATLNGTTVSAPLTLYPQQSPTSLILDRAETVGTAGATGTVRIAASQGHDVQMRLTSSNPEIAQVPAYAQIGSFGVAASFSITTTAPAASTVVTISAIGAGVTVSTTLTVHPAGGPVVSVAALALNPGTVTGGGTSTATLTLSAAAPSAGAPVSLSSSNTAVATVPASVTVPAGATSTTFPVTTSTVTAASSATISATGGGTTRSAVLTINPPTTQAADSVAIQQAEYDAGKRILRVGATSTNSTAVLRAYVTATGTLIGTLINDGAGRYRGELSATTNPQNITVKSSLGGSASRAVSLK